MLAFHDDPAVKEAYLNRVLEHQRLDQLIRGFYWHPSKHRGCALGCTLHMEYGCHEGLERLLNLPEWLGYCEESVFENGTYEHAMTWPARFLQAIAVGADMSLLNRDEFRLRNLACDDVSSRLDVVQEQFDQFGEWILTQLRALPGSAERRQAAGAKAIPAIVEQSDVMEQLLAQGAREEYEVLRPELPAISTQLRQGAVS